MDWVLDKVVDQSDCGASVGNTKITDLVFADDAVIFAESLEILVMALEALHEEAKPLGLEVSWLKTKVQNTQDSLTYLQGLLEGMQEYGIPLNRKLLVFGASLALTTGHPHTALDLILRSTALTHITIRSIKVMSLCQLGRIEEAIVALKAIAEIDLPGSARANRGLYILKEAHTESWGCPGAVTGVLVTCGAVTGVLVTCGAVTGVLVTCGAVTGVLVTLKCCCGRGASLSLTTTTKTKRHVRDNVQYTTGFKVSAAEAAVREGGRKEQLVEFGRIAKGLEEAGAISDKVLVMALEALHEEAKPLGLEVSWLKTKVQTLDEVVCQPIDRFERRPGQDRAILAASFTNTPQQHHQGGHLPPRHSAAPRPARRQGLMDME
ncbi:hypothetical protein GWK47_007392 [Chionoecetes opilio]|uniref:Reverse transcriptase domain-containing protein n=1 Tax=Chionoecetes opilio TaxID=41210 RepID=A0A8J4Y7N0_CHIOP|nr:hypothetical protein GWK47_007392 [Chionoecetes opilio]